MSQNKMEVNNLDFYYGDFQALNDINIEIKKNKVTALIGPSGCGKSTFLRTLNRMNDLIDGAQVDGNVYLDGEDIYKEKVDVVELRKKVGMVFQQRLCIARALAVKPEVLLMDEPASALDPVATAKIEELIEILKENYTIVIVTHSMQQAARVSDNTGFFLMGDLVEFDKTEPIFANPENQKTEDYITGRFG